MKLGAIISNWINPILQKRGIEVVNVNIDNPGWEGLSYKEKNLQLFLRQKETLDMFLQHGAISKAQHDKSLSDLKEKMWVMSRN